MNPLLKISEKMRPLFEPGGRLHALYPLYEAGDAFVFTPSDVTAGPPHVRDSLDAKRYMITVAVALIPCILLGMYNAGHQMHLASKVEASFWSDVWAGVLLVLPLIMVSYAAGGFWEVLFAIVRKHEINEGFLITGLLFPLTLPPTIPLWQVALGISFGVVIGKEIFGGVGFNVMNPALTARAFLFFAYPGQISGNSVWTALLPGKPVAEGFTGATSLAVAGAVPAGGDVLAALREAGFTLQGMISGLEGGSVGETSLIAVILGAVILLLSGVGSWRIMLGGLLGLAATATLFNLLAGEAARPIVHLPFWYHLAMGSFAFGIVFMATDPVSAAATNVGKWIYGFLVGALTIVVRLANPAYPEGVMLSILFMNVMAPLIDYFVLQAHIRSRARYLGSFNHA